MDDLSDRVLHPATGPIGIARSIKAGLEDRLDHELEGHLRHPVLERWYPMATLAAIALGYQPLPDRHRPERSHLQLLAQLGEELLDATRFDVTPRGGIA